MATIEEITALDVLDEDCFLAPVVPSKISRTFGGQVVTQTLDAIQRTVEGKRVHSLHGYFVGPGNAAEPARIEVERLRDGRSFSSRQARMYQDGKLIFVLTASLHKDGDEGPSHQDPMPKVMSPDEAAAAGGGAPYSTRIILREWEDWDIRLVPEPGRDEEAAETTGAGFRHVWFRNTSASLQGSEDQRLHQAALTYMSDMTLLRAALLPHQGEQVQLASLDHSIWFLRPVRADEWMLYVQNSPVAEGGTGVSQGKIHSQKGELLALVTQEGLMRYLRKELGDATAHGNWQNL
ncbi:acyl-CoA thioesterase II [Corynebacterium sp.]|uniref:acyl-CoA thioesterase n=1 Tax=Corynebacterium sp. TaxID=1720 RepID=UPI0026DC1F43|nr:acyl-CoA thioesterase domain-containing protein [Corynebacterium sp.]MDO5031743.1 thioesterase family protein [Corynebacterium sp.]